MQFDPDNKVIQLCAQGMNLEGSGKKKEALNIFQQAWEEAANNIEKFIAAHYVARLQKSISEKLYWDKIALGHALQVSNEDVKTAYPSLYLNIGKCYEDLNDLANAKINYDMALLYTPYLPDNGYGKFIKGGITNGLERVDKSIS